MVDRGISVVIPSFNHSRFIAGCLDSVLSQTRKPRQVIVVDDGSTDETTGVVNNYRGAVAVQLRPHEGLRATVAYGLSHVVGEYVLILASDDILYPEALELLGGALDTHQDVGVAYAAIDVINDEGILLRRDPFRGIRGKHHVPTLLAQDNYIPAPTAMCRLKALREIGEPLEVYCGDWERWLALMLAGWACFGVDATVAAYRRHAGNLSQVRVPRALESQAAMLARLAQRADLDSELRRTMLHESAKRYLTAAWGHLENRSTRAAQMDFVKAVRLPGRQLVELAELLGTVLWTGMYGVISRRQGGTGRANPQ